MELSSQRAEALAPESNPLEISTGWKAEDLGKPQIMVESIFGDSHPGSAHLDQFVDEAMRGITDAGGKGARYLTTDIRNGITQGHNGISYSLAHRDMIANMIEIHSNSIGLDGGVFIVSCDKPVPACLMELARFDVPSIVVTGGVMDTGSSLLVLEQIGAYSAVCQRGEIAKERLTCYKHNACPSCGVCSFIGTTSTMQIMAEALGLVSPDSALTPATCEDLKEMAYKAGLQVMELAREGLKVSDIVTMRSLKNVIMMHAAISGSTNSPLHIPAIAHELGLEIDAGTFDRMRRGACYLLDIKPAGKRPVQFFYYAGGIPAVMEEIKSMLHLDVMTVIGKTLGENLEELKTDEFYGRCDGYLRKWGLKRTDVIKTFEEPIRTDGVVTILRRSLAPEGSVVKHSAVPEEVFRAILKAKPFDCEEDIIEVVISRKIQPGDAVFIQYEGPKGSGMPEMFYIMEVISSDLELEKTIAPITGGRFPGASKGPAIGHASPEAAGGRLTILVEENDLIRIDISECVPGIIGVKGEELPKEGVERIPAEHRKAWKPREAKYRKGVLKAYSEHTVSPMKGGHMV